MNRGCAGRRWHGGQLRSLLFMGLLLLWWCGEAAAQVAAPEPVRILQVNSLVVQVDGVTEAEWYEIEGLLKDQVTLAGDTIPSEPLADDLAFFTRQYYIREGRPETLVDWEVNAEAIRLSVSPSLEILVGDITWSGGVRFAIAAPRCCSRA